MDRRTFLSGIIRFGFSTAAGLTLGCRGKQYAHVLEARDRDMVGSHTAGAETWEPLVQTSVAQLLGRQQQEAVHQASAPVSDLPKKRICFVGVENKSIEELYDFRDQIYEKVDTCISTSNEFDVINRRFVEAGLREAGIRPEDLFIPSKRRVFVCVMEKMEQPFEYLLFAKITSGTTHSNQKHYQRDYLFTLELVDLETGHTDKESAELRKGYHKTKLGAIKHYGHT